MEVWRIIGLCVWCLVCGIGAGIGIGKHLGWREGVKFATPRSRYEPYRRPK